MRIPRSIQLPSTSALVHKFWRAHNRSFLLEKEKNRTLYLKAILKALKHRAIGGEIAVFAYCIMSNHTHELIKYSGGSRRLSDYMRLAHGWFGLVLNKIMGTEGAVMSGRAKTLLVQDEIEHAKRVHFYIEANPLRAGIVKNLKNYAYSSYRFYAWGIRDQFTDMLTIPPWYLELGENDRQRQSVYRSMFEKYLSIESGSISKRLITEYFFGDESWVRDMKKQIRQLLKARFEPLVLN